MKNTTRASSSHSASIFSRHRHRTIKASGLNLFLAVIVVFAFTLPFPRSARSQEVPDGFTVTRVAALEHDDLGFDFLPDGRIIVINKHGIVRIVVNGALARHKLLNHPDVDSSGEGGLLGVAVDPDFPDEPYVYLFYSSKSPWNIVSRFTAHGKLKDPNSADITLDSEHKLVADMPSIHKQHNSGTLRFGSDKTLYISHGDDKFQVSPDNDIKDIKLVQDLSTLNGKILRINRDGSIPTDNPSFPDAPADRRPEIFAFGLRNPFRFALDPMTDELFIGDVGASNWEEFDLAKGGENFGWPRYEGKSLRNRSVTLSPPAPTFPIFKFKNGDAPTSAIALVTYRPVNYPNDSSFPPEFNGVHFYADFFRDFLHYLVYESGWWSGKWVSKDFGTGFRNLVDAQMGHDGSIYVLEYGNALKKIEYTRPTE